jgi:hypothetical protein
MWIVNREIHPKVFLPHTRWTAFPQFIALYLGPR